jgi:exosortase A-associated hydrolase 1
MKFFQQPVTFTCRQEWLLGVITRPEKPRARGVLIVVGGPQYRTGSHRQFFLLANHLAQEGYAVMRFDYRGMGDSTGGQQSFEEATDDVRAALDHFFNAVPELRDVAVWGLCDAASAALLYAYQDARVSGIAILNPWVRTAHGEARTYLKHYYAQHLLSAAPWKKLFKGELDLGGSLASFARNLKRASSARGAEALPERMAEGLARFRGRVLLILSGNDLTAREFTDVSEASPAWRRLLKSPRVSRHSLAEATHTFPRREWRDQVAGWTVRWLGSW